jgi:hypothetical protein
MRVEPESSITCISNVTIASHRTTKWDLNLVTPVNSTNKHASLKYTIVYCGHSLCTTSIQSSPQGSTALPCTPSSEHDDDDDVGLDIERGEVDIEVFTWVWSIVDFSQRIVLMLLCQVHKLIRGRAVKDVCYYCYSQWELLD